MEQEAYEKLADWLATTFRGLPGIKKPEFMDLIRYLYTEEEARLALEMGPEGGRLDELAATTGISKENLKPLIASMEKKGTLYTEPGSDDPVYRPLGLEVPGLAETSGWGDVSTPFKRELLGLMHKFRPIYVDEAVSELGQHSRAWCIVRALPPEATPDEHLYEQIRRATDYAAVSGCPCRLMDQHADPDDACDCPTDCCMSFGDMARWAVEQDHARHVAVDEAIQILERCAEAGLVHTGVPGVILCNCCKHACVNLYAMKMGKMHTYSKNHFFSRIDADTCTSCGTCVDACPVGAIRLEKTAEVDPEKCIGCGVCTTACEENSLQMVRRSEEEIARLDAEYMETFGKLMAMTKPDPLMMKRFGG
jgi:formate hydrogenlyase subunit 6/NADH:ubiquinone oxidoreductase subunit I